MPDSKRDLIVAEVVSVLQAGAGAAGVPVAKDSYTAQLTGDSIIVFWVEDQAERAGGRVTGHPVQLRTLLLAIECRGQGTAVKRARKVAGEFADYVEKTLSGLSKGVTEGSLYHAMLYVRTTCGLDQVDHSYSLARVEIEVSYQSRVNDPAVWA